MTIDPEKMASSWWKQIFRAPTHLAGSDCQFTGNIYSTLTVNSLGIDVKPNTSACATPCFFAYHPKRSPKEGPQIMIKSKGIKTKNHPTLWIKTIKILEKKHIDFE